MLPTIKCSGCGVCVAICPKQCILMEEDRDGFRYPKIDLKRCVGCNKCTNNCPTLHHSLSADSQNPKAYACKIMDEDIRKVSSSGGIFSAIAEYILKQGGVVFGAAFDESLTIKHIYVEELTELQRIRGSKYVQSDISDCYIQAEAFLKTGRMVLFTGTPCQVEGLRAFLKIEYDNLILMDIICHGVPSPKVWKEYRRWKEKNNGAKTTMANFRDKCSGWKNFSLSISFDNGTIKSTPLDKDPYMIAFLKNYCLRESCYDCSFKSIRRSSDFTIGDLWGIESIIPEMDDDRGVSCLFIQSDKGETLFQMIQEKIIYQEIDAQLVAEKNGAMTHSVYREPMREYFFAKLGKKSFERLVYEVCNPTCRTRMERKVILLVRK